MKKTLRLTVILSQIFSLILLTGCAQKRIKERILRDIAIGAVAGAALAQSKQNSREAYTIMYSGVGAAGLAIWSVFSNGESINQIESQNAKLKEQLKTYENQLKPKLYQEGKSLFSSPLPREVSSLVEPGEWKRYKMDQWVQDPNQPNAWIRQVEIFEIIPPVAK